MKIKLTICLLAFLNFYDAQENIIYQKPSAEILKLADYERPPSVLMNSKKDWVVFTYRPTYKTLEDLNQQEMKLAGLRINPVTNISSSVTYSNNLKIRKIDDKNEMQVKNMPANAKITYISFSPDEKKLALTNTTSKGVELWIVDMETAAAKKITGDNLNANLGTPYTWYNDSQSFLIRTLPQNRPALIDASKDLPTGPIVSTADGKVSQNRTYQDLLKNPQDEKNFEVLTASEIYQVDLNGNLKKIKDQDMYSGISFSPDGNYLLTTVIKKPFSYIVPLSRFPMTATVYDMKGNAVKTVNDVPLNEIMPKGFSSVRTGKRSMGWRSDVPATLVYAEALDGGDQYKTVDYRDEIFTWEAPFAAAPKSFFKTKQRYEGVSWTNDQYAVVSEGWYDTRNTKSYLVDLNNGESKVFDDRNYQDVYSDPGNFNTTKNQYGRYVIDMKGGKTYLIGDGFTKDGQHPFIDEMDVKSLKKKRLYTSNVKNAK
jgi:WD40 repeat protein